MENLTLVIQENKKYIKPFSIRIVQVDLNTSNENSPHLWYHKDCIPDILDDIFTIEKQK